MKRISKVIALALMLVMLSTNIVSAVTNDIQIFINNRELVIQEGYGRPSVSDGRTFVPLRAVAQGLGCTVGWENATRTVTINSNIKLKVGSNIIETPNGNVEMDVKVFTKPDGRTYVPISFIAKVLGYDVTWTNTAGLKVYINAKDTTVAVDENGNVIVVDTKNLVAPKYDNGYSQMDVVDGMVGFNKNSTIGTRPENSSLTDDVKKFNETVLKNTMMGLASNGSLDMDNGTNPQSYYNTWFSMTRNQNNNPVLEIRGWGYNEDQYGNRKVMATMNLTAEMLKYYCGSDAESIWAYIDNAAKNKIGIASEKPYQFGNTLIKFEDPGIKGINVIVLGKAK